MSTSDSIKLKYAYNDKKEIVYINDVLKNNGDKYFCINCNNELIARKGKIRKHHFSHKNEVTCNYETYLHKLAKNIFYKRYKNNLGKGQPFNLEYKTQKKCNSCLKTDPLNRICIFEPEEKRFNLIKVFDKIDIEKKHEDFIADILLSSSKNHEKIFIEIAVTHTCEKEKIDSSNRIVEFELSNDDDLDWLKNEEPLVSQNIAHYYNFKEIDEKEHFFPNSCIKKIPVFIILKNGKANIKKLSPRHILNEYSNPNYLKFQVLEDDKDIGIKFIVNVKSASLENIEVKNCYVCRFFAGNNRFNSGNKMFCKLKKEKIENSNYALHCSKYWMTEKDKIKL